MTPARALALSVRSVPSSEFGPTSEPFSGTNIIGTVIDMEKIANLEGRDGVFQESDDDRPIPPLYAGTVTNMSSLNHTRPHLQILLQGHMRYQAEL